MCRMCEDRLLLDHGVGDLVGVFDRSSELCPKCGRFPAGGGSDGEFFNLCYHCFSAGAGDLGDCSICAKEAL